jgi:hypothetical protein
VGLLAPRQPPNLEDQGIPFCRVITLDLSGMGGPTSSIGYRQHSSWDHVTTQAPPLRQSRDVINDLQFFDILAKPLAMGQASSFTRFLDHTQRRTTVGSTPLDQWSARRRDLYLTTHNTLSPCPRWDSNPQFLQANGCRPTPSNVWPLGSTATDLVSVYIRTVDRVALSVQRLTTGWTVRGSNSGGGQIFRTCPDLPWGPSSLL